MAEQVQFSSWRLIAKRQRAAEDAGNFPWTYNRSQACRWLLGTKLGPDEVVSCGAERYCPLKGALEASRHDGGTHDAASSESPTMAGVAGKAPHVESRGLARVLQSPHGHKIDTLRRHRS